MDRVKVVVLGGSGVATPELARALVASPGRETPLELVLVGRNASKLATVAGAARLLAGGDPLLSISHTTDSEAALAGAEFVINQVRVGGLEARLYDETFPHEVGLFGEETIGAGGFANGVRTVPVALAYARQIERLAPQALMLSFSNPASMVQYAVSRYTRVATVGLCDAPVMLIEAIARALNAPAAELTVDYVGLHHFGWVTGLWRRGRDLLPEALARAGEIVRDVDPAIAQAFGAIPSPYFRFLFHPERMLARQVGKRPRAAELADLQEEILADYGRALTTGAQPTVVERREARWYRMVIAPVLLALIEGRRAKTQPQPVRHIMNVVNASAIPWLPAEAIVETPAVVDGGRVRALAPGAASPAIRALVQQYCAYEMAAAEAIVERDRARALQALLLCPYVRTYEQAVGVLERAWGA